MKVRALDKYVFYNPDLIKQGATAVVVGDYSGDIPTKLDRLGFGVTVFEADQKNYEQLLINLPIESDIVVQNNALGAVTGTRKFFRYATPSSNSLFDYRTDKQPISEHEVECVSIKDFCTVHGQIDLMVCNCEGGEYEILETIMRNDLPVVQILVSFHRLPNNEKSLAYLKENMPAKYSIIDGNKKYNYKLLISKKLG